MLPDSTLISADTFLTQNFASALALSANGQWAVVGASGERNGETLRLEGVAYLYDLSTGAAVQSAKLSMMPDQVGSFGTSVAISGDGSLIAVGNPGDSFGDVDGVFNPDVIPAAGTVQIYGNDAGTVTLLAELFMPVPARLEAFGGNIALSADGTRLFATVAEIDDPFQNNDPRKVLVYDLTSGVPVLEHILGAALNPSTVQGSAFGDSLAVSANGQVVAVGAPIEAGEIDPVTGAPDPRRGAVYVYDTGGAEPVLRHHVALPMLMQSLDFGANLALSADGATLAVGGVRLNDPEARFDGRVFVYDLTGEEPVLRHMFTAPDADANDRFGAALALSADGSRLLVGSTGWDGEEFDPILGTGAFDVGLGYLLDISGEDVVVLETMRASDEVRLNQLGSTVALSADGNRAVMGASLGDGDVSGTGGVAYLDKGTAYVFDVPEPPLPLLVRLTAGDDAFTAPDLGTYAVFGRGGNDTILTQGGEDQIVGGAGDDVLSAGAGNDILMGNKGRDTLDGGAGDDRLEGGAQADLLTGGFGADVFVFAARSDSNRNNADRITDFSTEDDLIDLSAIDAMAGVAGDQAFAFLGTARFSGSAGDLRIIQGAEGVKVLADTTGDGRANFKLLLDGVADMSQEDFLL